MDPKPVPSVVNKNRCKNVISRLVFDENIQAESYFSELTIKMKEAELQYKIRKLASPFCILWEQCNTQPKLLEQDDWKTHREVIRLMSSDELKTLSKEILFHVCKDIIQKFPQTRITLLILCQQKEKSYLSKLTELQVLFSLRWQQITLTELVEQLYRFNKAILETDFKENSIKPQLLFKNYINNQNKRSVRVVGRYGLNSLWQQNLITIPGVTLNISETVTSKFSCPQQFIQAIDKETLNASSLLSTFQVSEKPGQRIGEVTSSKLYRFYTSIQGDDEL